MATLHRRPLSSPSLPPLFPFHPPSSPFTFPFLIIRITFLMNSLANLYASAVQPYLKDVPLLYSAEGSIVAMLLLVYASKIVHILSCVLLLARYDNVQSSHRYAGKNDGSWTWQRLTAQRAFSAHQNQWEAFIGFAAAMLLALQRASTAQRAELTQLANAFLCIRVFYNAVFVCAFNAPLSVVRSAVWAVGLAILLKIFSIGAPDISYAGVN